MAAPFRRRRHRRRRRRHKTNPSAALGRRRHPRRRRAAATALALAAAAAAGIRHPTLQLFTTHPTLVFTALAPSRRRLGSRPSLPDRRRRVRTPHPVYRKALLLRLYFI